MFDSVTSALIAAAPRLTGVDNERLASQITDAYIQTTVAKSLLETDLPAQDHLLDELRSIGASNEAIALAIDDPTLQQSAAYVAASAYHALAQALPNDDRTPRPLDSESISASVAATLLFLIADAAPDASEAASFIEADKNDPLYSLLELILLLGKGEIHLSSSRSAISLNPDEDPSTLGATIGYLKCERTLFALMARLNGHPPTAYGIESFANIASDMVATFTFSSGDGAQAVTNRFNGPWHLARLLDMAEPTLLQSATIEIDAPHDVDTAEWTQHLARVTQQRPLLWRNHRAALNMGFLNEGTSAVLAFPTGAGKSTLSELKVIATALRGKNVICLAPTLSLVDQLARAFRQVAPTASVIAQRDAGENVQGPSGFGSEIYVMTPESCLATLGLDHQRFGDVGLVMFDEAHLMHAEGPEPARRSIDATLCFLTLATRFPTADLLLVSAMIANAEELSDWLASITERKAIALDDPWKPTRQARGALVYDTQSLGVLRAQLNEAFQSSATQGVPTAISKAMTAVPYGFFSLRSTWESSNTRDYRFLRLLDGPVPLGVSGSRSKHNAWWLTPNANKVAAHLARATARSELKTLVFAQQPTWAASIARDISADTTRHTQLVAAERDLMKRIVDTLGTESAMYLNITEDGVQGDAIPHHSLLLPDERRLHERLYQRPDGVPVLVATSTVAQGMNFPSEFVIISSDRRFDPATNARTRIESHELLNAAGRAGRAGAHSNALVLVIPGDLVEYDGEGQIGAAWAPLQEAFSKSDQCLTLTDPFQPLLSALDNEDHSPLVDYLVRRLDSVADAAVGPRLIRRSLLAHTSRGTSLATWIDEKVAQLSAVVDAEDAEPWVRQCALISGLPLADIQFVAESLSSSLEEVGTIESWSTWVLNLMETRSAMTETILRTGSRSALTGPPEELDGWVTSGSMLVQHLRVLLPLWLRGESLLEIQQAGIARKLAKNSDEKLMFARKFMLRVVPDLAYMFSLPGIVLEQRAALANTEPLPMDHPLRTLGRCVELGVDSAEKLARLESSPNSSRRDVRSLE